MNIKKRGISPVVATVLLIVIVVAAAVIVFLWFRGVVKEEATKFGKNIKLVCEEVQFNAAYSDGLLQISNDGNVPIYSMNVRVIEGGNYRTIDLSGNLNWPVLGLNPGASFLSDMGGEFGNANKIILIPVLRGSKGESEENVACDERHGYEIEI